MDTLCKIVIFQCLIIVSLIGCQGEIDVPTEDSGLALLPQQVQDIAFRHLEILKGSEMTPEWTENAAYENYVRALYRPDVEGPAYYELAVNEGGFVIVSTGSHDDPVPQFSSAGSRPTDILAAQAEDHGETISRFYKLDELVYVAENDSENLVANIGPNALVNLQIGDSGATLTSEVGSWKELKRDYSIRFASEIEQLKHEVAPVWDAISADAQSSNGLYERLEPGDEDIDVSKVEWIPHYELIKNMKYNQEFPDEINNCATGCGAVAWAIVASYLDYVAEIFGSSGDEMGVYYLRTLKANELLERAPDINFPFDDNIRQMVLEIRSAVKTFCINGLGATAPWDMGSFADWANKKGATLSVEDTWIFAQASLAEKWIKEGRPVVIGIGFYEHYVVAIGWGVTIKQVLWWEQETEYVYTNFGWDGMGNGWIKNKALFYAGTIDD